MADQTRPEWRGTGDLKGKSGTLVIFSDGGLTEVLQALAREYPSTTFRWPDEPDFVKIYLKNVDENVVGQFDLNAFEFSWIPERIKDIFIGRCSGDDCSVSRQCAQPGCQCHKGRCR